MFEAQTYDKVLEEILSRAPDGIDLRQGSIFYDAVAGIAFKIAKYYADLEQVFEMVFLVTATGDYLTLKAEEYAVYRQAAATAKYRIKYDGELPELGTRFFCSGQYFVLAQDDALGIYIEAEKAGTEANDIPAGTSVVPTDTQRRTGRRRRGRREPPKACTGENRRTGRKRKPAALQNVVREHLRRRPCAHCSPLGGREHGQRRSH